MEINTTSLLPYVLDLLSRQPDLCTSIDALCEQIQDVVMDDIISPFGNLKRAVEFSVELGMNLGLLLLSDKRVRMPFNFRNRNDNKPAQPQPAKAKELVSPEQGRQVIKRLAKTLKDSRSAVIKQKTNTKARAKGPPKTGFKCKRGRPHAHKKGRPAKKRKTNARNAAVRQLAGTRSRRY
ncbi:uncharacterized protein [Drosophila virilis]|uniref:Uncharacterized protein n=1 Tax=Drosophila virilis TaxID=7244 RepID=B4LRB4_DROVI|nr:uncharacterized protein LOC6628142 [Drosophila virilis]EDW64584.1 uncharacterized protein Dvir_GJ21714 [Drosophila virilis]